MEPRPYAPNAYPQNFPIAASSSRLLERIWRPTCSWLPYVQAFGVDDDGILRQRAREWAARVLESLARERLPYIDGQPDACNEAVIYQDRLVRQVVPLRSLDPAGRVWEIGRLLSQGFGIVVLERITTWLRIMAFDPEDGPIGPLIEFKEGFFIDLLTGNSATNGSLFPFPVPHPLPGVAPLRVRWNLVLQRLSHENEPFPPLVSNGAPDSVPTGDIRGDWPSEWEDMRYRDQALGGIGHKWVGGGHGMVRLFATVFADPLSWSVEVAGRLSGYRQQAGRRSAALGNATRRH